MTAADVLIVEDEGVIAMDLSVQLADFGYGVTGIAASVDEAMARLETKRPNLVLMDIRLKGRADGIEGARRIGERHDLPIVYLTAHTDPATLARAGATTPYGYLSKPFRSEQLRATIETALAKHAADRVAHEARERTEATLESIGDAVVAVDAEGRVEYLNAVARSLTGWTTFEARGKPIETIMPLVDSVTGAEVPSPLREALQSRTAARFPANTVLVSRDGEHRPVEDACNPIFDASGDSAGAVIVFRDVTDRTELLQELTYQAKHDPVTDLANRWELERALDELVRDSRQRRGGHALLYIDLDQFKRVNDTAGHRAGDELLRVLARVLRAQFRGTDLVARVGGDEFAILLERCPLERALDAADALMRALADFKFEVDGHSFVIGASIGVAAIDGALETAQAALMAADAACYAAKENGRNRVEVYAPRNAALIARNGMNRAIDRLVDALAEGRLTLFAQPLMTLAEASATTPALIDLQVHLVEGNEALPLTADLREAAERSNVMSIIDRWTVQAALAKIASARSSEPGFATVHDRCHLVKLSPAALDDAATLAFIRSEIAQSGVDPSALCWVIGERQVLGRAGESAGLLRDLRSLGCRVALDEFGGAIGSFSVLRGLPIDFVKLDAAFLRDAEAGIVEHAVLETAARIGRQLGFRIIADRVQRQAAVAALIRIGVDYAQGEAIAAAVAFDDWVDARTNRRGVDKMSTTR